MRCTQHPNRSGLRVGYWWRSTQAFILCQQFLAATQFLMFTPSILRSLLLCRVFWSHTWLQWVLRSFELRSSYRRGIAKNISSTLNWHSRNFRVELELLGFSSTRAVRTQQSTLLDWNSGLSTLATRYPTIRLDSVVIIGVWKWNIRYRWFTCNVDFSGSDSSWNEVRLPCIVRIYL